MMRHPRGKGAGPKSDFYASTHDVAPTILGFLGIEQPAPMDGQDLTPLLEGKEPRATKGPHHPGLLPLHLLPGRAQGDVLPQRRDRRPPLRRRKRRGPEKRPGRNRARNREEDVRRVRPERRRRTPSDMLRPSASACQHARLRHACQHARAYGPRLSARFALRARFQLFVRPALLRTTNRCHGGRVRCS